MRIKIISYNILNGLCCEHRPYAVNEKRKKLLMKFLKKENPDILILCEASCWPITKQEESKDYGKPIDDICRNDCENHDFRWAPAVLTRFPVSSKNLSGYFKSFVRSSITIGKKMITLDAVHPRPELSEKDRKEFFSRVAKTRKEPYILAGDFNSLSPEDNYDMQRLIKGYERFMGEGGRAKAEDIIFSKAMMPLIEEGLIDTLTSINKPQFTVPTDSRNKNKDSAVRLDYIFCSQDFRVIESGIIRNHMTEKISDHYPVFAVLEI